MGASGVLVNLVVFVASKRLFGLGYESAFHEQQPLMTLAGTSYALRWFMIYSIIAFVVANVWNFVLNRHWTFASDHHSAWWRQFLPFFAVGLVSQLLGMVVEALLNIPTAWIGLPDSVFDDSSRLRNKANWAHLFMIMATVPIQYLLNKFWTFRAIRNPVAEILEQDPETHVIEVLSGHEPDKDNQ